MGTEGEGSMMSPGGAGGKNGGGSGSGFSGGIGGSTTEIFRQFNPKYDRGVGGGAGMGMGMGMGMEGSAMGMGMEGYAGWGKNHPHQAAQGEAERGCPRPVVARPWAPRG